MDDMRVLNTVKSIRVDKGLSVRELAKHSGVSGATISKVENGLVSPTQLTQLRICKALDMEVVEVFDLRWRDKPYL